MKSKVLTKFLMLFMCLILITSQVHAKIEDMPLVVEEAQSLSSTGVFEEFFYGYIVVDADEKEYLNRLLLIIESYLDNEFPGVKLIRYPGLHGLWFHVIDPIDGVWVMPRFPEVGKTYNFNVVALKSTVTQDRWGMIKKTFSLVIESPELNELRASYGLPERSFEMHLGWQQMNYSGPF